MLIPVDILPTFTTLLLPDGTLTGTIDNPNIASIGFANNFLKVSTSNNPLHIYEANDLNWDTLGLKIVTNPLSVAESEGAAGKSTGSLDLS